MTGTCIATVKVIGYSTLGLLTASYTYQVKQVIPGYLDRLNKRVSNVTDGQLYKIKALIKNSRVINIVLSSISASLFSMAFKYSPPSSKHPYLMYAALGGPLGVLVSLYRGYKSESKLLSMSAPVKTSAKSVKEKVPFEEEVDSNLTKSYIHVSDEDSSTVSTPVSSTPNSPLLNSDDSSLEEEVEQSLFKKNIANNLRSVGWSYEIGSWISGLTFLVTSVGLFGDYYLL